MKALGLTDRAAGALLGYHPRTISRYRVGELVTPLSIRLHMMAIHMLNGPERMRLNRAGYHLAVMLKEGRHE